MPRWSGRGRCGLRASIGFTGLRAYPHVLEILTRLERDRYTIGAALAPTLSWPATAATTLVGLAVLAGAWRRAHLGDEWRAFVYAIAAVLVLTPIVPMNYFVVLIVVLALFQPTFDPLWALPLALWVSPQVIVHHAWQRWVVLALVAATIVAATRPFTQTRPPQAAAPSHA
jgi:hypothetical protein